MDNEQNICPNCGARMNLQGLCLVCEFCGSSFLSEDYTVIDNVSLNCYTISLRYEYLKRNEQYIKSSKFVKVQHDSNEFRILSSPVYYANDGRFHINSKYFLYFDYVNSGIEDSMNIIVCSTKYVGNPHISILLDEEFVVMPKFEEWNGNLAIFKIGIGEFEEVCESISVTISSNLIDSTRDHYEELLPYCCRFYNTVFDKCKYTYSIHQLLISDKYGK